MASRAGTLAVLLAAAFAVGCDDGPRFDAPQVLGGVEIGVDVLEQGERLYIRYCATCHGTQGDGRGPSATGFWPAPRDFRAAKFKFAGVLDRGLPHDDELVRIVERGLHGTSMMPWDITESELRPIIHYIKTFSPPGKGFRNAKLEVSKPQIAADPFGAERREEAIEKGERLFHVTLQCTQCHPAYADSATYGAWGAKPRGINPYDSVPKWSANYNQVLLPPDFLRHPMRSVNERADIYRVVAYGLQGPMPGFPDLPPEQLWAVAYYVDSLSQLRGTPAAEELRNSLVR
jgi:mono/diheme cytochrome c family protein